VALNGQILSRLRTFTSLVAGVVAGVLGLTGLFGAVFYAVIVVLSGTLYTVVACRGKPLEYFAHGEQGRFMGNLTSGILTFILAWTIAYDSIYVF
jgi:hypothetical protein